MLRKRRKAVGRRRAAASDGGGGGGGPADAAAAAAARLAFLEPVLKPAVAAAQLRAPLHRGWGAAGAASVAGAEWRDAARWRDEARARGWAAWRGLPPQRWWLEVTECALALTLTSSLTFTLTLVLSPSPPLSRLASGRRSTSPSRASCPSWSRACCARVRRR